MDIQHGLKLEELRKDILLVAEQARHDSESETAAQAELLLGLKTKLDALQEEQSDCVRRIKILESLYFPELPRRWRQIQKADQQSNEWIYDHPSSFVSWLESQDRNDGLFYITGRVCISSSTAPKSAAKKSMTSRLEVGNRR